MSLIGILIALVVCGLVYYLITLLPLPEPFPMIIKIVLILFLILWLCSAVGIFSVPLLRVR